MKKADRLVPLISFCAVFALFLWIGHSAICAEEKAQKPTPGYVGSSQCRPCHEKFYQLWAPSHHGLAMQPYTAEFAAKSLTPQTEDIVVGKVAYRAEISADTGYVTEKAPGKDLKKFPILHALGGKNIIYFLTMLDRGILQVLPVAYDVNRKQWYDTAASGMRHFPDRGPDSPLHWTDRPYSFNTSCYGCHVSQLVKNYDLETDTYKTEWGEPGINCETCHGPAAEHVKVFTEAAKKGETPKDMKLVTVTQSRGYTPHQVDAACLSCHAKAASITSEFVPGEDFHQHNDLVTFEHQDYYADGRDLGENYTMTTWNMSPCTQDKKLDCMYCHTSSGRYRFAGGNANQACVPCHTEKADIRKHTRHKPNSGVTQCVLCHMPKTEFGRMIRSDHSMRPPMPAATAKFKSPNACNNCHPGKTPEWADAKVRKWHKRDYQAETLKLCSWVQQTRNGDWKNLDAILAYMQSSDRDEMFTNSFVRMLVTCTDEKKWPVLLKLIQNDPSPLIRGSSADAMLGYINDTSIPVLSKATADPYRLVRLRAASSLAVLPDERIPDEYRPAYLKAKQEYTASLLARPDDAMSHYNMGNFHVNQQQPAQAIDSFQTSIKLQKDHMPAYVNASMAYNSLNQNDKAVASLKEALKFNPDSVAA
ncbi:MAG: ammonia-forming cytochrome c nitrite reductase subunit c552, partial [Planctomycetota bacterium]